MKRLPVLKCVMMLLATLVVAEASAQSLAYRTYIDAGVASLRKKDFNQALLEARFAQNVLPSGWEAWSLEGAVHLAQDDPAAAVLGFARALASAPVNKQQDIRELLQNAVLMNWARNIASSPAPVAKSIECGPGTNDSDPDCQFEIGDRYYQGFGGVRDLGLAFSWFEKAALQGHARAQGLLGSMYIEGGVVQQDFATGHAWLERSASQRDPFASWVLGRLFVFGPNLPVDYQRATSLLTTACDGGLPVGCVLLGDLYSGGKGVTEDRSKASVFYERGCKGGNYLGCLQVGVMFQTGNGRPVDSRRALEFFDLACEAGKAAKVQDGCDRARQLRAAPK